MADVEEMKAALKAAGITVWNDGDQWTGVHDELTWFATPKPWAEAATEEEAIRVAYAKLPADAIPSEPQEQDEPIRLARTRDHEGNPLTDELRKWHDWSEEKLREMAAAEDMVGVGSVDAVMEQIFGKPPTAPTAAGSEEPKPLKFNLENPGEMIAASGAVKALHDAGYRAAPVASQAPAPKRPEAIKDAGLGKKYWAHEADAYMDYLECRVRELEAKLESAMTEEVMLRSQLLDLGKRPGEANHE